MPEQDSTRQKWKESTSWDALGFQELPNGAKVTTFRIGEPGDPNAPTVFRTYFPPGCTVAPHTHECDYCEIILEGTQEVTRRWYKEGDIRIAKGGTMYGPLVAGPEGVTVLVIFADGRWAPTGPSGGDDQGFFTEELSGSASAS